MLQIIQRRQYVERVEFALYFERIEHPGSGYAFPSDERGNLLQDQMPEPARANHADCLTKVGTVYHAPEVTRYQSSYVEPAVGRCSCGRKVVLGDALTNTCDCGRSYNMGGQEVCPELAEEPWEEY